jgi:Tubulin-tyrosine ligase family
VRLASYAYSLDKMNYYIHLTNNAVQSSCAEYGALMKGNIFPVTELEDYARAAGKRPEQPTFMAQIRETIRKAFDATYDILNPNLREHCFELFGFDFMVDEAFKVWMLECNSGPSLSESNAFLSQLLHRMIGTRGSRR